MRNYMDKLYDNLDQAKAFALSFTNFAYFYDDVGIWEFHTTVCKQCKKTYQSEDYLAPRASCKKATSILHSLEFGVSEELRNDLIENFDITKADFRPVRNKKREIVYYQITPQHTMLPLSEANDWPVDQLCSQCGTVLYDRPRRENEKGEPYFYITQDALDEMHDLNVTFEKFQRHYPLFVISRRVYEFLIERYPRTHYFPFFMKNKAESSP